MNREYLDTLPEEYNRFNVDLLENEKVVFADTLSSFETEKGLRLGGRAEFTLTNQRIIVCNGVGTWTVEIEEDVVCCNLIRQQLFFFKYIFFYMHLNKEIIFNDGKNKLVGFKFFFKKNGTERFEEIVNNLFN